MNYRSLARVAGRCVPVLFLCATFAAAQEKTTAYRGARILPAGAPPIEQGVLVIAGGKILAVGGSATPIPDGAVVVDCSGQTITPGLIDASFRGGAAANDQNEQSGEVTPQRKKPRAGDSAGLFVGVVDYASAFATASAVMPSSLK
ncbi:MAG: hypothetical protein KA020_01575, partial [Planctomycetes bacterium]|nr:hypothetical protein [Planctomycetota bacterium]